MAKKAAKKSATKKSPKRKGSHGGARKGSGMKKGTKIKRTVTQDIAYKKAEKRILAMQDKILDAQFVDALGSHTLIRIVYKEVKRKNGAIARIKDRTEIITNPKIIRAYFMDEYVNDKNEYVILTENKSNSKTGDSLLDRAHGKARQRIELEGSMQFRQATPEQMAATRTALKNVFDVVEDEDAPEDLGDEFESDEDEDENYEE